MKHPVKKACLREAVGRATNPAMGESGIEALYWDDETGLLMLHYAGEPEPWAIPLHTVKGFKMVKAQEAPRSWAQEPGIVALVGDAAALGHPAAPMLAPPALIAKRRGRPPGRAPQPAPVAVPLAAKSGRSDSGPAADVAAVLRTAAAKGAKSAKWANKPPTNGLAV
jgi:hypothetical protein